MKAPDTHSPGKRVPEQVSGCCIRSSWLCLEHPLCRQGGWRSSCRGKGSRAGVPSCAASCSLLPGQELVSLQGLAGSSCAHVMSAKSWCWLRLHSCLGLSSMSQTETKQREDAWGNPAQGLKAGIAMGKHGNLYVEPGAVTGVPESWVGRTKSRRIDADKERDGTRGSELLLVLGSVGLASLQWGYMRSPSVRAALVSQKTVSKPLSPPGFSQLCFVTCPQ